MRSLLACPACRAPLELGPARATCACGEAYRVVDGIPVLLAAESRTRHNVAQAAAHDAAADPELEVRRPQGAPALYGRLLHERLARSVAGIEPLLAGATAVTACGGPGMDAEFLARAGCRVLTVDVSLGSSRRAAERAGRGGLAVTPVVGDATRLPLADRSVDLAYVLDGLHHLEDPLAGLRELARVARRAVAVGEPAAAALTRLAVRAGAATDTEEGGNVVVRLEPGAAVAELHAAGFDRIATDRYGMHYDPDVGRVARALSRRRLHPPALAALRLVNRAAGGLGNKLSIRAERTGSGSAG